MVRLLNVRAMVPYHAGDLCVCAVLLCPFVLYRCTVLLLFTSVTCVETRRNKRPVDTPPAIHFPRYNSPRDIPPRPNMSRNMCLEHEQDFETWQNHVWNINRFLCLEQQQDYDLVIFRIICFNIFSFWKKQENADTQHRNHWGGGVCLLPTGLVVGARVSWVPG